MAAYDNVSLPGAPNIATAGNYADMLMKGLQAIPDKYYKAKDFQYQQQQRDLFQNGLPTQTDANGNPIKDANGQPAIDYNAIMRQVLQSGGAPALGQIGALQRQPLIDLLRSRLQSGGQDQPDEQPANGPVNTSSPNQTAAGLDKASQRLEGGGAPTYPRTAYTNPSNLSAGTDNEGRNPTIRQMAIDKGLDPESPQVKQAFAGTGLDRELFSPSVIAAAQKRLTELKGGGVSPQSPPSATLDAASGGAPPINAASANQGNESPSVGAGGGQAITPAPTAAAGGIQPSGPRVAQATSPVGGAAGMVPPAYRDNPLRWADILDKRAKKESDNGALAAAAGIPSKPFEDSAARYSKQADAIREQLAKAGERTTEEKNIASGAAAAQKRIEDDQKYYGSLHRGLAGSGMIAAQQKQNVDILRQVAASPNFIPGAGSDVALAYQRIAAQFGINPKGAAPREIFNQVAARILADQFSGMKSMAAETGEQGGRLFKSMLDIEEKANITSQDSLDGIKAKLDIIDKTGDLMMRWADLADDYKNKHGALDAGFDKQLRADIAKGRVPNVVPKAAGAPDVGHIEQGYRFKGGDHRDKKNWEPVSTGRP